MRCTHLLCDVVFGRTRVATGLVQEVHPDGRHRERAMEIARQICKCAPIGLRATKEAALTYIHQGEQAVIAAIPKIRKTVLASEDFKEGIHRAARSAHPGPLNGEPRMTMRYCHHTRRPADAGAAPRAGRNTDRRGAGARGRPARSTRAHRLSGAFRRTRAGPDRDRRTAAVGSAPGTWTWRRWTFA